MKKIIVMASELVFFYFACIKCNYLVEIFDAIVIKVQNTCLLCWKTLKYTTIFYFSLIYFLLNLKEFNFDIVVQLLFWKLTNLVNVPDVVDLQWTCCCQRSYNINLTLITLKIIHHFYFSCKVKFPFLCASF
jgi:hypothetical protein